MIETLAQAAAILLVQEGGGRTYLRGVDNAKFRRQVIPGDRIRLEVSLLRRRTRLARVRGVAWVGETVVAEADLLLALEAAPAEAHPSASVAPGARIGTGTTIGPNAVIGPDVAIGRNCRIRASAVIEGWTELGDENDVYPFASIGQAPQDLKYRGAPTRLAIGHRNVFREFVTIHRGTEHGGGLTTIGDRNLFMAYSHVAHDCHVGSEVIFGNGATIGGHVTVEDYATVSAFSGVHQFCRVGQHAFVGGYSVLTKDAMPFAKTVGNRAKIYGLNTIGLLRRGFAPDTVAKLKKAYRLLLTSKLNTTRAIAQIAESEDLACDEVRYLLQFIAQSQRGVTLKHGTKRAEDGGDD
jgi:UDP-N-acetylglucosamine acyltransferase